MDCSGFRVELRGDDWRRTFMSVAPDSTLVRFATFELNIREQQLRKGGSLVRLPPQPLKIPVWLSTHSGQLVTRQELRERTWEPGTLVDFEQGLNHCIKQIRLALGDDADNPRFIETIPKRGYRFVAEVHIDEIGRAARAAPDRRVTDTPARIESARHPARALLWVPGATRGSPRSADGTRTCAGA